DTSNYATSLAVVTTGGEEVVCAKKQLLAVKEGQLGLRQSDAVFHHTAALPALLQQVRETGALKNIEAVGVSKTPRPQQGSYMPCFLAGVSFAAAFATALEVPLVYTSHQQGHVAAAFFGTQKPKLQNGRALVFHLSGGTTELLLCRHYTILENLGTSLDLYAGQAVDRLGVQLGFAFPAGEKVTQLARTCGEAIRPKENVKGMDCHFSGLQNQYEAMLGQGKDAAYAAKYCLLCIAETVVQLACNARSIYPGLPVICAGGVMASTVIAEYVLQNLPNVYFVPPALSSDNAVGVALIAAKEAGHG
ncbi:MAG: glycoprotease, partial [Oscillospiraceae bacterium]